MLANRRMATTQAKAPNAYFKVLSMGSSGGGVYINGAGCFFSTLDSTGADVDSFSGIGPLPGGLDGPSSKRLKSNFLVFSLSCWLFIFLFSSAFDLLLTFTGC